jgi:hypothetical protein
MNISVLSSEFVTLKVFDLPGSEFAKSANEIKPAESYVVDFEAAGLSSGIYFFKI